ncbi:MAG: LytTR family DNA-binding domain-containing protein, partial [Eubacterium sp.]
LECFESGYALLDAMKNKQLFDILILEITIPDMDGITLAKELRKMNNESFIIYLTASADYALQSYEVNTFQYLLKPLEPEKLYVTLDQLTQKLLFKQTQKFIVTTATGIERINAHDISFIEHVNHVLYINMRDESLISTANSTATLTAFENQLNEVNFLRPHRAFIVNLFVVRTLTAESFVLENGSVIPIARRRYTSVKKQYLDFLLHHLRGALVR